MSDVESERPGTAGPIRPGPVRALKGDDDLGTGKVLDFWRWALGDLRMNTARGFLAEYLVARALEDRAEARVEWAPHDVTAADGTRVEVKATGRLQSWTSPRLTPPRWAFRSVAATQSWSEQDGRYLEVDPWDRVDVWVFALQTTTDPDAYDPRDVSQWEFRVLPHRWLLRSGLRSASAATIDRLGATRTDQTELRAAVSQARAANDATART